MGSLNLMKKTERERKQGARCQAETERENNMRLTAETRNPRKRIANQDQDLLYLETEKGG